MCLCVHVRVTYTPGRWSNLCCTYLCWIVSSVRSFSSSSPGFSRSVSSRRPESNSAQAGISPTDLHTNHPFLVHSTTAVEWGHLLWCGCHLKGELCHCLPVLLGEAVVLFLRIDSSQSRSYFPVDTYHFMVDESGNVKIFQQDLLPVFRGQG